MQAVRAWIVTSVPASVANGVKCLNAHQMTSKGLCAAYDASRIIACAAAVAPCAASLLGSLETAIAPGAYR
jgi:hypothetical protein